MSRVRAALLLTALATSLVGAETRLPAPTPQPPPTAVATFAGGCFWCMEQAFDQVDGVLSTTSGYTGGRLAQPDHASVSAGHTGHVEAVRVRYDPARVDYRYLLAVFWVNIDALDAGGQFCDRGESYQSVIFVHSQQQRRTAEASLELVERSAGFDAPIRTRIAAAGPFHVAEPVHQDYWIKNPVRYRFYKYQCGRDRRLRQLWGESAGKP